MGRAKFAPAEAGKGRAGQASGGAPRARSTHQRLDGRPVGTGQPGAGGPRFRCTATCARVPARARRGRPRRDGRGHSVRLHVEQRGEGPQPRRVAAVVAGEGTELVEHQPVLPLAGALVAPRHLPGDPLPLRHRERATVDCPPRCPDPGPEGRPASRAFFVRQCGALTHQSQTLYCIHLGGLRSGLCLGWEPESMGRRSAFWVRFDRSHRLRGWR